MTFQGGKRIGHAHIASGEPLVNLTIQENHELSELLRCNFEVEKSKLH